MANEEIKQQILNIGIRKLEPATGVSHHTINRTLKREHVRRKTLAKIVSGFDTEDSELVLQLFSPPLPDG